MRGLLDRAVRGLPRHYERVFLLDHVRKLGCGRVTRHLSVSMGAIRGRVSVTLHGLESRLGRCLPLLIFVVWCFFLCFL